MSKSAIDFKQQSIEHNITRWNINDCSFCDYSCGFVIKGNNVFYDNGCNCTYTPNKLRKSSFEDIARHYNMQSNEKVISEYNEFWNFNA